ncbi:MAG: hypothetical protein JRH15_20400 [Deltaproteobacteria bacterium]|nr:hypothetical protein [Deltaproteobacteria bacterium]
MNYLVMKYLFWTAMSYGLQLFFSIVQLLLSLYLIVSGALCIAGQGQDRKWLQRLGLGTDYLPESRRLVGCLKIALGIAMLLPISLGAPFWFTSIACLAAFLFIFYMARQKTPSSERPGKRARYAVCLAAIFIFGLTVYEGKDLIVTTKVVFKKAMVYRTSEKSWQQEHNPNTPKVGAMAADFELFDPSGKKRFRLSEFQGKRPVVLIFGSYT